MVKTLFHSLAYNYIVSNRSAETVTDTVSEAEFATETSQTATITETSSKGDTSELRNKVPSPIFSESAIVTEITENSDHQESRKKKRQPQKWKKNAAKVIKNVVVPTPQAAVRKSLPEKWDRTAVTTAKENAPMFLRRKKEKQSSAVIGVVGT